MVSRRNFFSIFIMMAVLFFMFQFSQVFKNQGNNYNLNEYAEEEHPTGKITWLKANADERQSDLQNFVVFVGNKNGQMGQTVREWSAYAKMGFVSYENFGEMQLDLEKNPPRLVFVDTEEFDYTYQIETVMGLAKEHSLTFVFGGAPDMADMKRSLKLSDFFGIDASGTNTVKAKGLDIFPGFLLGGEIIYEPPKKMEDEKAERIQDLSYDLQWYITGSGTKTYMVGMLDDEDMDKELYPAIIWRNTYGKSQIYVVSGGYINGGGGFGVINGILYEASDYYLYPVVNARNVVLVDYPGYASENEDVMMKLYARSQSAVQRDIMWPGIAALLKQEGIKPSCMVDPQYDYSDDVWPQSADVEFYLQQLKEVDGEAGWSLNAKEGIGLTGKINTDKSFFEAVDSGYKYATVYADEMTEELQENLSENDAMERITSAVTLHEADLPYLSYLNDDVTLQCAVSEAMDYAYSKDFEVRGLLTALGYSSVTMDIHRVIWPKTQDDQWEIYFEDVSSNVSSYWNMYKGFERTTLSQSDIRIRNFLNLSYSDERKDDTITVTVEDSKDSWFILRTHNENVSDVFGGTCEKLEDNVFLVNITGNSAKITLEASENDFKFE